MEWSLLLVLLAGTILGVAWLWHFRNRLALRPWAVFPLAVIHTALGVVCVSLFAGLENFELTLTGGMSLYGGIFFLPLFYWLAGRGFHRNLKQVFDVMTLCLISSLLTARFNCIVSGCCLGRLLPGSQSVRWPTRELEILFHIVLLILLAARVEKNKRPGTVYPIYMMAYGTFRFLEEFLREGKPVLLGLHPAHIWSLVSIAVGWSIYFELNRYYTAKKTRNRARR